LALWEASDVRTDPTASELRKTGISVIGDVPWGAHLCHFYETKEDLLDILIPYFRAGLENNEFCIWVVSDPLGEEEARNTLRQVVPDADRYLEAGRMEIVPHRRFLSSRQRTSSADHIEVIPHTDWYLKDGTFVAERVLSGWNQQLADARAKGYAGLRANGNEAWLTAENWKAFSEYEKTLDENLAGQRMIVLCSYPLTGSSATQILDVVDTHQLAIVRREGKWEIVETPELKRAKAEIQRLNDELEQKVEERTRELATTNEALRAEIAERKLAEEAVRRAENRIRLVIDTTPALIHTGRPDGYLDCFNQRWLKYVGLPLEEIKGWAWTNVIHPEDVKGMVNKWRAVIASGEPFQYEARVRRADGEYRWMLHHKVPLRDEQGDIVKWYGSSIDIEDCKRAERQSQLLIDAIPQQIWSGSPDGTLDYCNERWRSYMGLDPEELQGSGWQTMLHPDDRDRVLKAWHEAVANGTPYEQEERHRRADGTYRWFLARGLPLSDAEGRIIRWYGTNTDIEERKQAEKELEQATDQSRALSRRLFQIQEEERRHLARELHDEIGQTLTAAKINTEMLRAAVPPDLAPRLNENAAILDRLLQQTRQISLDLRPPLLDDLGLVPALRWYVNQQAERAGLEGKFSADPLADDVPPHIQIAGFRLAQEAITNVVRHAQARTLLVEVGRAGTSLRLMVRDDGKGFDVAAAEARAEQGASLGLLGMKERAALAGGRVRIISCPGNGATVEILLFLDVAESALPGLEIA
jgi:PAS domain S-box-containing protein